MIKRFPPINDREQLSDRIIGLRPNTNYRVYIWARTSQGNGQPAHLDVRTANANGECSFPAIPFLVKCSPSRLLTQRKRVLGFQKRFRPPAVLSRLRRSFAVQGFLSFYTKVVHSTFVQSLEMVPFFLRAIINFFPSRHKTSLFKGTGLFCLTNRFRKRVFFFTNRRFPLRYFLHHSATKCVARDN